MFRDSSTRNYWPVAICAACVVVTVARMHAHAEKADHAPPAAAAAESTADGGLLRTFVAELIGIRPGTKGFPSSFTMGTSGGPPEEGPSHEVTLTAPFSVPRYEVPQNLYQAIMGQNPSRWQGPRNSIENISWRDAVEFCSRLTAALHQAKLIAADEEIRLPTEAEWEYACRAGTSTAYSFGDKAVAAGDAGHQATVLSRFAWHTGNAAGNDPAVGALEPNPWGLYDMHGYLWEYADDDWHATYADAPPDGRAWQEAAAAGVERPESPKKVIRGGSWRDGYEALRSTSRRAVGVNEKNDAVGLRCVKGRVGAGRKLPSP